ncbi:Gfo/Idh/MocA family protein [Dyadobacter subterraneus]|uniref:Gfo/Idh/MocA family oxidoreductase n=1 Tax=Dyadobacter subterraneus TaxID=2773304 RepID=A0ABR9WBE0_9BACT|nr:Gfo/Idh/MocA family oxidoreductase [Dyadobacter subterraneus]MBE9462767.1 Gfo/Idh/MocA family oxidoreductase [Dyadobacter subterraneus]
MDQIKWGIIGCGNVTEVKSGPAFNKVLNSQLVAVMRRDAEKAEDYAKRHNVPKWYSNVDDLINDPEVNAIYIATPPNVHEEYAERAMRAGKPVYVEKPMAMNAEECDRMNAVSEETGIPLFVAYYRRSLPYFVKLKELIYSNIIGDIRYVNICLQWQPYDEEVGELRKPRWRVQPEISGGGHFHDLASHQFDYLEYVLGPIKQASGIARNQAGLYEADDITVANFEFESGILGTGTWCYTVNKEQREDSAQIVGSKGRIKFSFFEKFDIIVETQSGTETFTIPYPAHVQQPLIELIVAELRGEGKSPSNGVTGGRANLVMDWITKGQKQVLPSPKIFK